MWRGRAAGSAEAGQPIDQAGAIRQPVLIGFDCRDHGGEGIAPLQQEIGQACDKTDLSAAHPAQKVLHEMGKVGDGLILHGRRHPLERMGMTEQLVNGGRVGGIVLKPDDQFIEYLDVPLGF